MAVRVRARSTLLARTLALAMALALPAAALAQTTRPAKNTPAPAPASNSKQPSKQPATPPAKNPAPAKIPSTAAPTLADQMRAVLSAKSEPAQIRLVRALRGLKDPALAPLFTTMSANPSGALRAEALLALAEIDPARGIDLLLVKKLDARPQAYVLSSALDETLLKPEQLEDLARWTDIEAGIYVSVAARLASSGKRIDSARLTEIAGGKDPIVAAVAAIILGQLSPKDPPHKAIADLLASPAPGKDQALRMVLGMVRDRQLASGLEFARAVHAQAAKDPLLRLEATATLLVIEPSAERVAALLAAELAPGDTADRLRLALAAGFAALDRESGLPASAVSPLVKDRDPLVALLGKGIESLGKKTDPAALVALAKRRNVPACQWALQAAKRFPEEHARAVRLAMLDQALAGDQRGIEDLAASAAAALAEADPETLRAPLLAAIERQDTSTSIGILTGLIRAANPKGVALTEIARPASVPGEGPTWPNPRVEGVALLVKARFLEKLPPAEIERLGAVAQGAGSLPEIARTQAAWMTLKAITDDRGALSRLLADLVK